MNLVQLWEFIICPKCEKGHPETYTNSKYTENGGKTWNYDFGFVCDECNRKTVFYDTSMPGITQYKPLVKFLINKGFFKESEGIRLL